MEFERRIDSRKESYDGTFRSYVSFSPDARGHSDQRFHRWNDTVFQSFRKSVGGGMGMDKSIPPHGDINASNFHENALFPV